MVGIHDYQAGKFLTQSGIEADIMRPTTAMICTEDIAVGLSNVCRFGGQVRKHYSVASHSLLVMSLAPPELSVYALLHDASEAYLGDVIKPLKHIIASIYGEIEKLWMRKICTKYGLNYLGMRLIKQYDMKALEMEDMYLRRAAVDINGNVLVTPKLVEFMEIFYGASPQWVAGKYELNLVSAIQRCALSV